MTAFLDTETAPAIKPTPPKIRVKMLTQSLGLMAGTYGNRHTMLSTIYIYIIRHTCCSSNQQWENTFIKTAEYGPIFGFQMSLISRNTQSIN